MTKMTKRSRESYRRRYRRLQAQYESYASVQYRRFFKEQALKLELTGDNPNMWRSQIENQLRLEDFISVYTRIYSHIARMHGKRVGRDIDAMSKVFDLNRFETDVQQAITRYINKFGLKRVISIRRSFVEHILDLISTDENLVLSYNEITRIIHAVAGKRSFYRWQAERIARTEATGASNYGAIRSAQAFGFVLNKEWISAQDSRVRRRPEGEYDHLEMNGKVVPQNDFFEFNGGQDRIQFPGDPTGEPGNIINCRCTIALIPARDEQGNLIRK